MSEQTPVGTLLTMVDDEDVPAPDAAVTTFAEPDPSPPPPSTPPPPPETSSSADRERLGFVEGILNERSDDPLLVDNPTHRIRRRLLRGETLTADDGEAEGATNGLVGSVVRLMTEWGFEFEFGYLEDGKKRTYTLNNPQHEPTKRVRKNTSSSGSTKGKRKSALERELERNPVHAELRERLLAGEPVSLGEAKLMGATDNFVRRLIADLEKNEGLTFGTQGHGLERTYCLTRRPKGRPRATSAPPKDQDDKGKGLTKSPIANVNGNSPGSMPTSAVDMLFADLVTPPPRLGGAVRIMGAMLNEDDDSVSMLLKNGEGMWKARIEAFASSDEGPQQ